MRGFAEELAVLQQADMGLIPRVSCDHRIPETLHSPKVTQAGSFLSHIICSDGHYSMFSSTDALPTSLVPGLRLVHYVMGFQAVFFLSRVMVCSPNTLKIIVCLSNNLLGTCC